MTFPAIDARTTTDLLDLTALWRDEGRTVVAVLHDHAQVRRALFRNLVARARWKQRMLNRFNSG